MQHPAHATNQVALITPHTRLVGVIGRSIKHSLNPAMHNAAFADLKLDWAYVPLPVMPQAIQPALAGLQALNFVGVNVSAPYRQAVIRYLDELSDAARITGAVNTIHLHDGKFYGYNSDAIGFLNAMRDAGYDPSGMRAVVLGAGGAARAAVFALARANARSVTVFNRTAERAAFLVDDLADAFPDSDLGFEALNTKTLTTLGSAVDLIVNTTSVGMYPHTTNSPWPDTVPIPANAICYELVYNPLETEFLRQAQRVGAPTIDGLGMFIHQGVFAFKQWTGQQAPMAVMRAVCLQKLKPTV